MNEEAFPQENAVNFSKVMRTVEALDYNATDLFVGAICRRTSILSRCPWFQGVPSWGLPACRGFQSHICHRPPCRLGCCHREPVALHISPLLCLQSDCKTMGSQHLWELHPNAAHLLRPRRHELGLGRPNNHSPVPYSYTSTAQQASKGSFQPLTHILHHTFTFLRPRSPCSTRSGSLSPSSKLYGFAQSPL